MAEDDLGMYDTESDVEVKQPFGRPSIHITKTSITTTIRIGDQEVVVINPQYVDQLQRRLVAMENKMRFLEDEIRRTAHNDRSAMARLRSQLDGKIDRE